VYSISWWFLGPVFTQKNWDDTCFFSFYLSNINHGKDFDVPSKKIIANKYTINKYFAIDLTKPIFLL
jgi:hypothetical protein